MTIIWCMVHEIWSVTDRIFCHFGPCFALLPLNNPKNQNFEKNETLPDDIINLPMCTINNHTMHGSWNIKRDGQNLLSFSTIIFPFTPLTTWKIKILKKWKNSRRYYHFTQVYYKWQPSDVSFLKYEAWQTKYCVILDCFLPFYPTKKKIKLLKNKKNPPRDMIILHKFTKNHDHMLYCSLGIACNVSNCYFWFWAIFCPFSSLTAQKILKFKKNEKNIWRYHQFTIVYQKSLLFAILFLRYDVWQM